MSLCKYTSSFWTVMETLRIALLPPIKQTHYLLCLEVTIEKCHSQTIWCTVHS